MHKKTVSKTIKNMIIASIGAALSINSIQASAAQPDTGGPGTLCFHIPTTPNHPDPEGSYVAVRIQRRISNALRVQNRLLIQREAKGMAIGRAPMPGEPEPWGEWVGTPLTGTCHKHENEMQCSFQSISAITTQLPAPIGGTSIETGSGHLTFVYNLQDKTTIMSQIGSVDVSYFDPAGNPIPDNVAPLPTFKKIKDFITDVENVNCRTVPHPEIPYFSIP